MINPQRTILNPDSPRLAKRWGVAVLRPRFLGRVACVLLLRVACLLLLIVAGPLSTHAQTPIPILLSEPTSTRAVALESVTFTPEPFAVVSPNSWNADHRTRVMLFAMNLTLQPGETLSSITAEAEDAGQRHYNLLVEYLGPVPDQPWLSAVVLRLSDDLGDVGDVLVRISHNGVASNRVRIAIGHRGGGPADDAGAGPTQPPPYAITGKVREAGVGLNAVTFNLSKNPAVSQTETFATNTDGAYQFSVSVAGGSYTLTPAKTFYEFTPASRTFSNLSNHQTNIDFVATRQKYSIAGFVRNDAGQGLAGIQVTLTSEAGTNLGTGVSANGGSYAFENLPAGFGYTVTPASNNVFTFASQSTSTLASNLTLNFNGQRRSYAISGRIMDGAIGLSGISVSLNGTQVFTTIDHFGDYVFYNLPAGLAYTVTPANNSVFTFTSQNTSELTGNLPLNFSGQRRTYDISGRITEGANGLAGVSVALNGIEALVTTDADGSYSFTNLPAGLAYAVTPPNTNVFTFTSQNTNALTSNLTFNLSAQRRTYAISGLITDGEIVLPGVSVSLNGSQAVTTTDSGGNYSFANLPAGFGYTVTAANSNIFTFTSQSTSALTSNLTFNFIGQRRPYTISGHFTDETSSLAGVSVALIGSPAVTTTDANGNFTFLNVAAGRNYIVTPTKAHYFFTPATLAVNNLSGNTTANFSSVLRYFIAGRMADDSGQGMAGVTMTLSGSQSSAVVTSANGSYSFTVPPGSYTVTPSIEQDWYTYSPASLTFNNINDDHTGNFVATATPLSDPGYVLEFDGSPTTVDYGYYWDPGVDLGHFFWEFWAMPGPNAGATYMLTDGYGGAHALLFGVGSLNTSEPNRYQFIGNILNGVTYENYFRSDQGPAPGEWGHFAVGWDGQNVITYFNGVPVGKSPFTGPRFSPGIGGGGSWLMIGGSDHSNFDGRIAQVRGFEMNNPREDPTGVDKTLVEATFAPQTIFSRGGNLLSYYFRPSLKLADLSTGYSGKSHPGIRRSMLNGYFSGCFGCPLPEFVIDPTAPNFATGAAPAPVQVASAPVTPNGARIFDSFSRANSTYLFNSPGGLGSTEGGSAGAQPWQTNQNSSSPQPFGILNGRAVLLANDTYLTWIETGSLTGNLDTRVERRPGLAGSGLDTGLSFRVLDDRNFFFAYTSAGAAASNPRRLTVGYYLNGQRVDLTSGINLPASWTILQVLTKNSGEFKVYANGVLLYTATNSNLANATGVGLYNNSRGLGLVNRWDNFTVYDAP